MSLPITVLILTKNEESAISECIASIQDFEQILIIDSKSSDRTREIAQSYGAQVVEFIWDGNYPKKKQWALERSEISNNWVLFLDADERVSPELSSELLTLFEKGEPLDFGAFEIPLQYYFLGKGLNHGHKVRKIALVDRTKCFFSPVNDLHVTNMWEVEGHYQPMFKFSLGKLSNRIMHQDPDPLFDYFARHNRYSDWEAELRVNPEMRESVRNMRTKQGKIFEKLPAKPFFFFLYSYFIRSGWRDGKIGFNYAVALSFYYWQISIKTLEKRINAQSQEF